MLAILSGIRLLSFEKETLSSSSKQFAMPFLIPPSLILSVYCAVANAETAIAIARTAVNNLFKVRDDKNGFFIGIGFGFGSDYCKISGYRDYFVSPSCVMACPVLRSYLVGGEVDEADVEAEGAVGLDVFVSGRAVGDVVGEDGLDGVADVHLLYDDGPAGDEAGAVECGCEVGGAVDEGAVIEADGVVDGGRRGVVGLQVFGVLFADEAVVYGARGRIRGRVGGEQGTALGVGARKLLLNPLLVGVAPVGVFLPGGLYVIGATGEDGSGYQYQQGGGNYAG